MNDIFKRKALNHNKLIAYGFSLSPCGYNYETDIMNGQFILAVSVNFESIVDTKLIEADTGEEYILYKTSASGSFVGEIRCAVEEALREVAAACFETEVFKTEQAKSLIKYVRNQYGDELEFLWTKFPDNAVWRRKDTDKWYGAILTVDQKKLGFETSKIVEIIDLRVEPEFMSELLKKEGYYPGWHMNKRNWYTIILDMSVDTNEIIRRIDKSYHLAKK